MKRPPLPVIPPDDERAMLEAQAPGVEPPPALRARVMSRIAREAQRAPGITTSRAGDAQWTRMREGVETRTVTDDGCTRTWLLRMAPGALLPAHEHTHGDEECLVLEGGVLLGDELLGAGDYQLARRGTSHGVVKSPGGCLLLLRSPSLP